MKHPRLKLAFLFLVALSLTTLYLVYRSEQSTIETEQQTLAPPEPAPAPVRPGPAPRDESNATRPDRKPAIEPIPEPALPEEDDVVTTDFLADLAAFTLEHFHPARTVQNPGPEHLLTLSVKSVNMRYGIHLFGLGHEQEGLLSARREILKYILRIPTLNLLSSMYATRFREELISRAGATSRLFVSGDRETERALTDTEIAAFLELLAAKVRETGQVIKGLTADPTPLELLKVHRDAVERVNAAHARFWGKGEDLMPLEADRAAEEIKKSILTRERVKEEYLKAVRSSASLEHISDQEVFYLGQWVARRLAADQGSVETIHHLAEILIRTSEQLSAPAV
jgi:hypothetical protein